MARLSGVLLLLSLQLLATGEPHPEPASYRDVQSKLPTQELLTRYLLSRIFGKPQPEDQEPESSFVHPLRSKDPLQKLLDHAKANIDVIDFRNPDEKYFEEDHLRLPRQPEILSPVDDGFDYVSYPENPQRSSPSDTVATFLPFPGTEPNRRPRHTSKGKSAVEKQTARLPLTKLADKQFYIGLFFKANWYKAEQYCRFHGMHLASINSEDEQRNLEDHIQSIGMGNEHFWSSGTDQAEEGKFVWLSTGRPLTYENWNSGEPNNFEYENGVGEHCLELWNRDGKGLKWNDTPCSFESYFVCEI